MYWNGRNAGDPVAPRLLACRYALVTLRLRPNFGMAHYQAAVCYERLGMLQQALTEAEKALEMAW